MSAGLRGALAPLRLAAARSRAAPARWVLAALGIAIAVGLLGAAAGGGSVAGERAARELVARLPAAERTVRVAWTGGLPPGIERAGRAALTRLAPGPQTSSVLLQPTAFDAARAARRAVVQVAAIAPLGRWVRLTSGRLPRRCDAARCEVVALGGPRVPDVLLRDRARVVTVGRGTLRSSVPLGFVPRPPQPGQLAGARPAALLAGADPAALEALPALGSVFRSHAWSAPLDPRATPSWELAALRGRIGRTAIALRARDQGFTLVAPTAALGAARERAREARRRVVLVGAGAAALLAAFTLLVAGTLRRDLERERARLERLGARRWQRALLGVGECAWPAALGCLAGAALAVGVTALRAERVGLGAGALLRHGLVTPGGLLGLLACGAAATGLLVLGSAASRAGTGRVGDVVALGAAGALALALSRGGVAPGDGDDPLALLLAPLACLAAGLVVARAAGPALRGLERAVRRGPLGLRLAALGLARAPGAPAVTLAVVAVSAGLACFAAAYAATLERGARDQAASTVPLDVRVEEGPGLVAPLAAARRERWSALVGGGAVLPVQRGSVTVPRGARRVELPLLGVPAAGLAHLRGWRSGDGSAPRAALARRLAGRGATALVGPSVPVGARSLRVRARATGGGLELVAHVVDADGNAARVPLGDVGGTARELRGALPPGGGRLVALELRLPSGLRATEGHQQAENPSSRAVPAGTLALGGLAIDGAPVSLAGWVGRGPARAPAVRGGTARVAFRFDPPARALVRPRQPTDATPLPVLVDRGTARGAAPGGLLPVSVGGVALRARVVGTLRRFPTLEPGAEGMVVADEAALRTALSADAPGTGAPDELWLGVAPGAPERRLRAALAGPGALGTLRVSSRRAERARLADDPLARELTRTLGLAALVALLTAAGGVVLAGVVAVRDEAAELEDLEALGVTPAALRASVRARAALLAGGGLLAGLALGAALLGLVVRAVGLTPAGALPVPPLVAEVPWATWALGALAVAAVVALGTACTTRRAFGEEGGR